MHTTLPWGVLCQRRILDHFGKTIYTVTMANGLITKVEDLAGRSVSYQWTGTQLTQVTDVMGNLWKYEYDGNGQITSRTDPVGLPAEMYSYDAVGNRMSSAHQPGNWVYNQNNQMVRYPERISFNQSPASDTQVSYTLQGHIHKESGTQIEKTYTYNAAERLNKYENSQGVKAQYRYDPFGRRISKSIKKDGIFQIIYFIYGVQTLMGELGRDGKLAKAYAFNPMTGQQGLWSTDPIWQADVVNGDLISNETSYQYLHTDHLSTPMLATDKAGIITWKAVSEAFGAMDVIESATEVNLRFPGQYWDEESRNHYNYNRNYNFNAGRYSQGDPIGLNGGLIFICMEMEIRSQIWMIWGCFQEDLWLGQVAPMEELTLFGV